MFVPKEYFLLIFQTCEKDFGGRREGRLVSEANVPLLPRLNWQKSVKDTAKERR